MVRETRRQFLAGFACAIGGGAVAALGLPGLAMASSEQAVITGARMETRPGQTRMVFDVSKNVEHSLFSLASPDRVVLDLKDTRLISGLSFSAAQSDTLARVRHSPRNSGSDLRLVMDVKKSVQISSEVIDNPSGQGKQLLVSLRHAENQPGLAPPVAVKRIKDADTVARDVIVAIDAGHGGNDPGAVGKRGTKEKDIVLKVARRLEALLRREPGFRPVMIRNSDVYLPLRGRIRKAREKKADLFISIHADASLNHKARGSSVYVLSSNGASSEAARWLADQENAADLIGGVSLDDKDDTLAEILLDLSQTHTLESSHTVAQDVLTELSKVGKVHSPRVERAGFAVLKSPDIPSVLVETAFISNPSEEKRLKTVAYQNAIAKSLLKGVRAYFYENAPRGTALAQQRINVAKHVVKRGDTLSGVAQRYRVNLEAIRAANKLKSDQVRVGQVLSIPTNT